MSCHGLSGSGVEISGSLCCALLNSQQDWHDNTLWFSCEEMPGHQTAVFALPRHIREPLTSVVDSLKDVCPQRPSYHDAASSHNHLIILWKFISHREVLTYVTWYLVCVFWPAWPDVPDHCLQLLISCSSCSDVVHLLWGSWHTVHDCCNVALDLRVCDSEGSVTVCLPQHGSSPAHTQPLA